MFDDDMCFLAWHASVASDILGICFWLGPSPGLCTGRTASENPCYGGIEAERISVRGASCSRATQLPAGNALDPDGVEVLALSFSSYSHLELGLDGEMTGRVTARQ